jgi:Glycosyl hydrolase catalytic core
VPKAVVISGGLSPAATDGTNYNPADFLTDMYADGAKGNFDVLGMHPYTFPAAPASFGEGSAWSEMAETAPSIRSIMSEYGDGAKQIWITEYGAPTVGPQAISQADQAQELSQAIGYARENSWIGAFYIYTWRDIATVAPLDNGFGPWPAQRRRHAETGVRDGADGAGRGLSGDVAAGAAGIGAAGTGPRVPGRWVPGRWVPGRWVPGRWVPGRWVPGPRLPGRRVSAQRVSGRGGTGIGAVSWRRGVWRVGGGWRR